MRFNFPALSRLYLPLLAAVVLLTSFGGYYFFYVKHQEEYYTQRNLRELAVMTTQIQEQIRTYQKVLQNQADYSLWSHHRQLRGLRGETSKAEIKRCFPENDLTEVKQCLVKLYINKRVPGLTYVEPANKTAREEPPDDPRREEALRRAPRTEQPLLDPPSKLRTEEPLLMQDGGKYWLHLFADRSEGLNIQGDKVPFRIRARTSLQDLVKKSGRQGQFDSVLLVDSDGTVIFQSEHPELHIARLGKVVEKKDHVATDVLPVEFGGISYKLFMQPVHLPLAKGGAKNQPEQRGEDDLALERKDRLETAFAALLGRPAGRFTLDQGSAGSEVPRWVLCGLVESDEFQTKTLAISYSWIIWFFFLLLMAFLLWPFFKLALLAPAERLHRLESFKLLLATLLGSAALTLCVTDVYYFQRLMGRLDGRLKDLAEQMDANVSEELERISNQLALYEKARNEKFCGGGESLLGSMLTADCLAGTHSYPYLDMVFWADEKGQQLMKWSAQEQPTPLLPIEKREYFTRIRDHHRSIRNLALLKAEQGQGKRFWMESALFHSGWVFTPGTPVLTRQTFPSR